MRGSNGSRVMLRMAQLSLGWEMVKCMAMRWCREWADGEASRGFCR